MKENICCENEPHAAELRSKLSHLANSYVTTYKPSAAALKKHRVLTRLKRNKNIVILKPDKGNATVIINRHDYDIAMYDLISDSSKFVKLGKDPTLLREGQLQRFLRGLKKKGFFEEEVYKGIYPGGSKPGRLYGNPKMHKKIQQGKNVPPFRPIISSIGTFNYALAKFLSKMLSPHIPMKYCARDSFTFAEEVGKLDLKGKTLISFDVTSLFTQIPLEETIDIAVDLIFEKDPGITISREELKKLFFFATSKTHFLFNGEYYDQTDGVAMGSPLGPILANLFMGVKEDQWLQEYSGIKPEFYRRYVDDTFLVFENEAEGDRFFEYLNTRHQNIKFTKETESSNGIPFLDIYICKGGPTPLTTVYRKETYTGLLTNFFSFTYFPYKTRLLQTLLHRAFNINSTWWGFHLEAKRIKSILEKNAFPTKIIDLGIKKFVDRVYAAKSEAKDIPEAKDDKAKPEERYFKLPYVGRFSKVVENKIRDLVKEHCKGIKVTLVFTPFKIAQFFSPKDPIPKLLKSNVVYKFNCGGCNATYIGETTRHFTTRMTEHLERDKESHIYKHLKANLGCMQASDTSSFSILDQARTQFQLKLKEGMHIQWEKPSLNHQVRSYRIGIII